MHCGLWHNKQSFFAPLHAFSPDLCQSESKITNPTFCLHFCLGGKNVWKTIQLVQFNSVAQSCPTLRPHESQHARAPCPSPTPGVYPNSCPSSRWCHPAISSSVVPFSSCPQSLPASGSFPMSQPFAWSGQSTGVSALASFLPKNTQGWSSSE